MIEEINRKDGTTAWRVRYYESGRGGVRRSATFDSHDDALDFDATRRLRKRRGELHLLDGGTETLAQMAEAWWDNHVTSLERHTQIAYQQMLDNHVMPDLGGLSLREISPGRIKRFRQDLERRGVGKDAVRKSMVVVQGIFRYAIEEELVDRNPVSVVRKPSAKRQKAIVVFAPATIERVRHALLADGRLGDATLVSVLAYGGLRPEEALALSWTHIGQRTIHVERAVAYGELKGTKNGRSRSVRLLSPLRHDLGAWSLARGRPDGDALVFPTSAGTLWHKHDWDNWRKRIWVPAAKEANALGPPYNCRHSFSSLLLHEGHPVTYVAQQLGHGIDMTLRTYAHVIEELVDGPKVTAEQAIARTRRPRVDLSPETAKPSTDKIPANLHSSGWIRTTDLAIMSGAL